MLPGRITASGFLGPDTRSLADIIQADEETCARLGLDFAALAAELKRLRDAGSRGLGDPISVGRFLVTSGEARGVLPCPWDDGVFHKNSIVVEADGLRLVYSDLSIHLVEAHHFFQGRLSEFRLEPESLKRLFKP